MRCAIMQPTYLPWSGYFNLIYNCDIFVFLDHVQYTKNEWINRNRVKTPQGWAYLTIPIKTHGKLHQPICKTEIVDNQHWRKDHLKTIEFNYRKAPHYGDFMPIMEKIYNQHWKNISDLNIYCIMRILEFLSIKREIFTSSHFKVDGQRDDLVINICKMFKADEYFSPIGANAYVDEKKFVKNKIKLIYQNYSNNYPTYPQLWGEFISHLSVIDLIFNCGYSSVKYINQYQK